MDRLRLFEAHGVVFSGTSGDQAYGRCPFTGKDNKFYVNTVSWLWDSKTAGMSGNIAQFLDRIAAHYESQMTPELLDSLATDRGLPVQAFNGWHIGWTGSAYSIPVRNLNGTCTDVRLYRPGKFCMATTAATVGLLGAEHLATYPMVPVYVCEGEWDTIAAKWLMDCSTKNQGVVVGVPGAGTFKQDWAPWLADRVVHCLYDHDGPGEDGEIIAWKRLHTVVKKMTFIHWPDAYPSGFDVRDWAIASAVNNKADAPLAWGKLHKLFIDRPRKRMLDAAPLGNDPKPGPPTGDVSGNGHKPTAWKTPPTYADVIATFKKWLFLDNTDAIRVMLAVHISQLLDGPPVWLFLVGSPGSAKTETLSTLGLIEQIYMTSSLTAPSLISGASWKDNGDPSLIPRLNGMTLVIKDFTSILTMRDAEKDEVFGILRDAYDGTCGKEFGNGVIRRYASRFTVLAAVTPSIYALSSQHTALGERFLKFSTGDNLNHTSEEEIINRAIDNINRETTMRAELQDVVLNYVTRRLDHDQIRLHPPSIPPDIKTRIIHLAKFGARMRGSVSRDTYRNEIIITRPSAEVGSRLGIQLAKLAKSLAAVEGRDTVNDDDYRILKKTMLDTIPQRSEDVVRHVLKRCPASDDWVSVYDLSVATRYPQMTIQRVLQDMTVLDVTTRQGSTFKSSFTLSPYIRGCIDKAQLYVSEAEINRKTQFTVRCRIRRIGRPAKRVIPTRLKGA